MYSRPDLTSSTPLNRILDASLNRAGEGLRVVEDFVRFVLDDPFLTGQAKTLRHELAAATETIAPSDRHSSRETRLDVGTQLSTQAENRRVDLWDVCAASLKRTEQSLRSLEEYGKLVSGEFARTIEALRYRLYTLEKAIDIGRTSGARLNDIRLCVLIDSRASVEEYVRLVRMLVDAGPVMIQLRDKELDDRELLERARILVSLTSGNPPALPGVTRRETEAMAMPPAELIDRKVSAHQELRSLRSLSIINDRADIAAAVNADGVHLGQEDMSVKNARAIVGTRMLVGVSTHNIEQARQAVLDGANYLGTGPTFSSPTKKFDTLAGLEYLQQISREVRLPTFAIGGITAGNLPEVLATGISRVAVSSAVIASADPASAARELLAMLNFQQS